MGSVTARKRGTKWSYRFEIASIAEKRQWATGSGFKTKAEALEAGNIAYNEYKNAGNIFNKLFDEDVFIMETIWICVYRDTIEEHNASTNLTEILVTKEFAEQYVKECLNEYFNTFEDFWDEYTADDTEDFYRYAMKHNAVIETMNW